MGPKQEPCTSAEAKFLRAASHIGFSSCNLNAKLSRTKKSWSCHSSQLARARPQPQAQ